MSTLTIEAASTGLGSTRALRRTTGWLFVIGALAFGAALAGEDVTPAALGGAALVAGGLLGAQRPPGDRKSP